MDIENLFARIGEGECLCLLPIGRVHLKAPILLTPKISLHPANSFSPETFRVVGWPKYDFDEMERRYGVDLGDGMRTVTVEGSDLNWFKSAATGIDLPEFFGSALIALSFVIDWNAFFDPTSHEAHLEMLGRAMAEAEAVFDLVRFERCNLSTPQTLPGRVGLLEGTSFCSGLFYAPRDHESYIIGGEIVGHQLLKGIGLDLFGVGSVPIIGTGNVGYIARHGLRLFSEAMEAVTETSKFVQMMSLLEFLANPEDYISMQKVKGLIARHAARDRADYDAIIKDFFYLTSDKTEDKGKNNGLRHNIVHCGKRLEDLTTTKQRADIFRRLERYAGVPLKDFIVHSNGNWAEIDGLRTQAGIRLGIENAK